MSAAEHLDEAIDVGCSRDDHDHVGDHRAEVMQEAARIALSLRQFEPATGARWAAQVSENVGILRVADALTAEGKGTGTTGGEPTPPSRFTATPLDVDVYLRQILAEDVYLRYQQVIGNLAVSEAARDARMGAALRQVGGEPSMAELVREVADEIDPRKGAGPYPAVLLCSQHNGFGPCPGAPKCTPGGGR